MIKKIAEVLNTIIDYLISGYSDEKARFTLIDAKLLQQFKAVQLMHDDDKKLSKL